MDKLQKGKRCFPDYGKKDISKIKKSPIMFITAGKTNNIYEMPAEHHEKLLKNNIMKTYGKALPKLANSINLEAKQIAKNLELADRIEKFTKAEAFVTLKDHKDSFITYSTCRLINPSKNKLQK